MPDLIFYALPALLVFAITFGALETAGIFKNRRLNGLIGLIVAGFSLTSQQVLTYVWAAMPWAALLFIVIFFFGFLRSIFTPKKEGQKPDYILIAIIAMLGLLLIYTQPAILTWLPSFGGSDVGLAIGLIIIAIIFYATYSASKK